MKTDIWMPIFIGDYLKDTRHLSTEEHGAYILILIEMWTKEGRLPVSTLHRVALMTEEKFKKIWENISPFFTKINGGITQKRLKKELALSKKRRKASKLNGLKGGRPSKPIGKPIGKPRRNPEGNPRKTSSPSPSLNNTTVLRNHLLMVFKVVNPVKEDYSRYTKAAKYFDDKGATMQEIDRRCANYRGRWPQMELTVNALAKHWDAMNLKQTEAKVGDYQ